MQNTEIRPIAAAFRDALLESRFQVYEYKSNAIRMTLFAALTLIASLVFIRNDFIFFGIRPVLFAVLTARSLHLVASLLLLYSVWKRKSFALLPFWMFLCLGLNVGINLTRPIDHIMGMFSDIIFIFMGYAFVPAVLLLRVSLILLFAAAQVVIVFFMRSGLTDAELTAVVFAFFAANVLGIAYAWNGERGARQKYAALLREKALQRALKERAADLEESNGALDSFSRATAHDLRNPLSGIVGMVDLIRMECEADPSRYAAISDYVESLEFTAAQMTGIIDALLLLARIRRTDAVEIQPVELVAALREISRRLQPDIARYQGEIRLPEEHFVAAAYAPWLMEAVANILGNALKYGGPAPVVDVALKRTGDSIVISVADRGPGIPDDEKTRIFSEYHRIPGQKKDGLGLGLSIARRAVYRMGGSIRVEDREGGGTVFEIVLKAAAPGSSRGQALPIALSRGLR